ncbi:MAG: glycosyltransferase family 1 protein [Sediminibacterium sp.]
MRIAVNAIFLQPDRMEGYGHYVKEVFSRLVKQYPGHDFIFVFDRPCGEKFTDDPNVLQVVVPPQARHPVSWKYWYDVTAPLALRKYRPDVWVQPYGFCSLTTTVPQLLVVHDLAFIHYPQYIPWYQRRYYQWFTPAFLRKAKKIITVSEFSKAAILEHYTIAPERVTVIKGAARTVFQPLPWQEKEAVKDSYADGMEYFLFTGGIHPRKNLLNLLKAFSLFKKWQHSNMKLLVAGRLAWQYDTILEKLKTYKYREDVVLLDHLPDDQLARVTASAYALVYPSYFEGFGLPIAEAMQCGVPVITSNTSSMPETGGAAALYADPGDPDAIAKHMLTLYKDEIFRSRLIEAGKEHAAGFHWDKAAAAFWQQILALVPGER